MCTRHSGQRILAAKAGTSPEHSNIPAFPEHDRAGKRCGRLPSTPTPICWMPFWATHARKTPEKEIYEKARRCWVWSWSNTANTWQKICPQHSARWKFACALQFPKILLLDEPAAGMNPNETHELLFVCKS